MLPYKLKNNKYIEPMEYKYIEYIDQPNLIVPIFFIYYVYTWNLNIKEIQYLYYESSKFYKIRNMIKEGVFLRYYILPFYKEYCLLIINDRIQLKNLYTNEILFNYLLRRKKLLKDIYYIVNNIIKIDKIEFTDYITNWINAVKGQQLLLQI